MKKKGISLIVLIITIIVILILAAAVILSITKANPIKNAQKAVNENDLKVAQEAVVAWIGNRWIQEKDGILGEEIGALYSGIITKTPSDVEVNLDGNKSIIQVALEEMGLEMLEEIEIVNNRVVSITKNGIKYDGKKEEVIPPDEEYSKVENGEVVTGTNATITGKKPSYDNPVIPVGFKTMETEKATWEDSDQDGKPDGWNEGLVIQDENENEYVWIPCTLDGMNNTVIYEKRNCSISMQGGINKEQAEDDILPVTEENEQIEKYGGFYVARYEASLPDEQTTEELMETKTFSASDNNRTDIGKAQSKADKIVWNNIDYNNAKTVSEAVMSNEYVQSGLITGIQWDTMCTFISQIAENFLIDSTKYGNYLNKYGYTITGFYKTTRSAVKYTKGSYEKLTESSLLLTTGKFGEIDENGSPKNLYDVGGNVHEWCAEKYKTSNGVIRGGSFANAGNKFPTLMRASFALTATDSTQGFRIVLYIK